VSPPTTALKRGATATKRVMRPTLIGSFRNWAGLIGLLSLSDGSLQRAWFQDGQRLSGPRPLACWGLIAAVVEKASVGVARRRRAVAGDASPTRHSRTRRRPIPSDVSRITVLTCECHFIEFIVAPLAGALNSTPRAQKVRINILPYIIFSKIGMSKNVISYFPYFQISYFICSKFHISMFPYFHI
jgi:hypothetical protein